MARSADSDSGGARVRARHASYIGQDGNLGDVLAAEVEKGHSGGALELPLGDGLMPLATEDRDVAFAVRRARNDPECALTFPSLMRWREELATCWATCSGRCGKMKWMKRMKWIKTYGV